MMLLSAPVVLACLFTDMTLGIINRFASQLNVYILAMGIKSGLAAFLMLLYLATLISRGQEKLTGFSIDLLMLRNFF
jgi:type III secretion protein T